MLVDRFRLPRRLPWRESVGGRGSGLVRVSVVEAKDDVGEFLCERGSLGGERSQIDIEPLLVSAEEQIAVENHAGFDPGWPSAVER